MDKFEFSVGCGPFKFGQSREKVETIDADTDLWSIDDFGYNENGLNWIESYHDAPYELWIKGRDILSMPRLDAALFIACQSKDFGQAQGGSLYFTDLGMVMFQFESEARWFGFFKPGMTAYDHGECLRPMTSQSIAEYYEQQTSENFRAELGIKSIFA